MTPLQWTVVVLVSAPITLPVSALACAVGGWMLLKIALGLLSATRLVWSSILGKPI